MSLTGTLGIAIRVDAGNAVSVAFSPVRHIDTGRLFTGKPWLEAAKLARLMFAVCGNGQAIAMAMAAQAAAGEQANKVSVLARSMLTCAEALREHASRIFMDWPQLVDDTPMAETMLSISRAYTALSNSFDFDAVLNGTAAETALLSASESANTLAGVVRKAIDAPEFHVADRLIARSASLGGEALVENDGTVLGRRSGNSRLAGSGLERRIRARLIEVELLCDWLESQDRPCPLSLRAENTGDQTGASQVEVARGLLRHEIRLDDGIVADCKIAAPTSANFMASGVAENAIKALETSDPARFEWMARLAVLEIDPCVAYDVRFTNA